MHSFKVFTFAGSVVALAQLYTTFAAPSPTQFDTPEMSSSLAERDIATPETRTYPLKTAKKTSRKQLSRRSPFHPDILMARSNTGPLATVTQLLSAGSCVDDDRNLIRE